MNRIRLMIKLMMRQNNNAKTKKITTNHKSVSKAKSVILLSNRKNSKKIKKSLLKPKKTDLFIVCVDYRNC